MLTRDFFESCKIDFLKMMNVGLTLVHPYTNIFLKKKIYTKIFEWDFSTSSKKRDFSQLR